MKIYYFPSCRVGVGVGVSLGILNCNFEFCPLNFNFFSKYYLLNTIYSCGSASGVGVGAAFVGIGARVAFGAGIIAGGLCSGN